MISPPSLLAVAAWCLAGAVPAQETIGHLLDAGARKLLGDACFASESDSDRAAIVLRRSLTR